MADDAITTEPGHPVPAAVVRVHAVLRGVADAPAWALRGSETREALVGIVRARAALDELEARLLDEGEANGAFSDVDATSAAAWLAHATRMTRREARRRAGLGHDLARHDTAREAMTTGHLLADQAAVVCAAVDDLPDEPEVRQRCEKELVRLAEHHDARELKVLGRRVLEVVDPEAADAHEAKLLEREEKAAARATSLSMWDDGDGTVRGRFALPALEGGMLRKALTAIAAPKHQRANSETYDHTRPSAERLGQAFGEYVARYPADKLPHAGGVNATVVVTMTLDTLQGGLEDATIDTGGRLSAGAARRLACEAGLVPVVLDGASLPLAAPRRRPPAALPHPGTAPRPRDQPEALPRRRLRHPRLAVPCAPRQALAARRRHQRARRPAALPAAPRARAPADPDTRPAQVSPGVRSRRSATGAVPADLT